MVHRTTLLGIGKTRSQTIYREDHNQTRDRHAAANQNSDLEKLISLT